MKIEETVKLQSKVEEKIEALGFVHCEAPDNANVSDKYGQRSIAAVNMVVEVPSIGMKINASMWARLEKNGDVSFQASVPKALKPVDKVAREAFLAHLENAACSWAGFPEAKDFAISKLAGLIQPTKAGQVRRPTINGTVAEAAARFKAPTATT